MAVGVETFADMNHPRVGSFLREIRNDLETQLRSKRFLAMVHKTMFDAAGNLNEKRLIETLLKTSVELTAFVTRTILQTSCTIKKGGGKKFLVNKLNTIVESNFNNNNNDNNNNSNILSGYTSDPKNVDEDLLGQIEEVLKKQKETPLMAKAVVHFNLLVLALYSNIKSTLKKALALPIRIVNRAVNYVTRKNGVYHNERSNENVIGSDLNTQIDNFSFQIFLHIMTVLFSMMVNTGSDFLESAGATFFANYPSSFNAPIPMVQEGVGIINYITPRPVGLPETNREDIGMELTFTGLSPQLVNATQVAILNTPQYSRAMNNSTRFSLVDVNVCSAIVPGKETNANRTQKNLLAKGNLSKEVLALPPPSPIRLLDPFSRGVRIAQPNELCPRREPLPEAVVPGKFSNRTMNEIAMLHAFGMYYEGGEFGFALVRNSKTGELDFTTDLIGLFRRGSTCTAYVGNTRCYIEGIGMDVVAIGHWHPFGPERLQSHPSFGDMYAPVRNAIRNKVPYHMVLAQEGKYLFHVSGNITELLPTLYDLDDVTTVQGLIDRSLKQGNTRNQDSLSEVYGNALACNEFTSGRIASNENLGTIHYKGKDYTFGITIDYITNSDMNSGVAFDMSLVNNYKGVNRTHHFSSGTWVPKTQGSTLIPPGEFLPTVLRTVYSPTDITQRPSEFRSQPEHSPYLGIVNRGLRPESCRVHATTLSQFDGIIPAERICQVAVCLENTQCTKDMFSHMKPTVNTMYWKIRASVSEQFGVKNWGKDPNMVRNNIIVERRMLEYVQDNFETLAVPAVRYFNDTMLMTAVRPTAAQERFRRVAPYLLPGPRAMLVAATAISDMFNASEEERRYIKPRYPKYEPPKGGRQTRRKSKPKV